MALDPALGLLFKSHPWHGVAIGPEAPGERFAPVLGPHLGKG